MRTTAWYYASEDEWTVNERPEWSRLVRSALDAMAQEFRRRGFSGAPTSIVRPTRKARPNPKPAKRPCRATSAGETMAAWKDPERVRPPWYVRPSPQDKHERLRALQRIEKASLRPVEIGGTVRMSVAWLYSIGAEANSEVATREGKVVGHEDSWVRVRWGGDSQPTLVAREHLDAGDDPKHEIARPLPAIRLVDPYDEPYVMGAEEHDYADDMTNDIHDRVWPPAPRSDVCLATALQVGSGLANSCVCASHGPSACLVRNVGE